MKVDVDGALLALERFLLRVKPGFATDHRLVAEAEKLSLAYTESRIIDDDAAASLGYLAHFGPRAIVAVSRALRSLPEFSAAQQPVVVDVGAGSGASALAWLFAGARHVSLIERSGASIDLARKLLDGRAFTTTKAPAAVAPPNLEATIATSAFTVGEFSDDVDVRALFTRLAPKARDVVVVDAGDRPRARRLQRLRDELVQDAGVVVYGPCGHRDPCPALTRKRDWCHDRVEKGLPPALAKFASHVGRDDRWMSLSYLAWGRGTATSAPAVVVIGEPGKEKGRVRAPICGPAGLRFLQALKRDRAAFDVVAGLERGARLPVPGDAEGDTWHVADPAVLT
ncbi:MAG: small ribosomal subunit Rsm22 family protein [Deltaproteobacteria bacterium]|nr:small ribosomal subunit Rsm22 family protein [Deltaproteobacteria bacterium]